MLGDGVACRDATQGVWSGNWFFRKMYRCTSCCCSYTQIASNSPEKDIAFVGSYSYAVSMVGCDSSSACIRLSSWIRDLFILSLASSKRLSFEIMSIFVSMLIDSLICFSSPIPVVYGILPFKAHMNFWYTRVRTPCCGCEGNNPPYGEDNAPWTKSFSCFHRFNH